MSKKRIYTLFIIAAIPAYMGLGLSLYCHIRSSHEITWNILGVVAGILAVLVTVLMGWQLFNAVSFDPKIRKIEKEMQRTIIRQMKKQEEYVNYKISDIGARLLFRCALAEKAEKQYCLCFHNLISAICETINNPITHKDEVGIIEKEIIDVIKNIEKSNLEILLEKEVKDRYIDIIKKSNLERSNDILQFLFNIQLIV